jgi:hypothetical protein
MYVGRIHYQPLSTINASKENSRDKTAIIHNMYTIANTGIEDSGAGLLKDLSFTTQFTIAIF